MQQHKVTKFISARTAQDLEEKMLAIQVSSSMFFQFRDINQAKDGKWYAWFDVPLTRAKEVNNAIE